MILTCFVELPNCAYSQMPNTSSDAIFCLIKYLRWTRRGKHVSSTWPFSLHFIVTICCAHCTLSPLSCTHFYHNESWDLCAVLDSGVAYSRNVTRILITASLWGRTALMEAGGINMFYFSSFSWPVQIEDRGSLGKGAGWCCLGMFIPGKFSMWLVWSLLNSEKRGDAERK